MSDSPHNKIPLLDGSDDQIGEDADRALYQAAASGKCGSVVALLAAGAKASSTGDNRWTSLFAASHYGYLDIVKVSDAQMYHVLVLLASGSFDL